MPTVGLNVCLLLGALCTCSEADLTEIAKLSREEQIAKEKKEELLEKQKTLLQNSEVSEALW